MSNKQQKPQLNIPVVSDSIDWDVLITKHYDNAIKDNPEYEKTHTRNEMKTYWLEKIKYHIEHNKINFIKEILEFYSTPKKERGWFHFGV